MKVKSQWLAGACALTFACVPLAFASTGTTASKSPPAQQAKTTTTTTTTTQKSKAMPSAKSGYRHISAAEMTRIQQALSAKGFSVKADGHWGKATRAALAQFQKKNGLKATGYPNHATLAKLGITSAK